MLKYNDLRKGVIFLLEGEPYEVLEYSITAQGQHRRPVSKTKIRNLKTGAIISRNFKQSEEFDGAEIETKKIKFIFGHRGKYIFSEIDNPSKRFELTSGVLGEKTQYLRPAVELEAISFQEKIINIELPIKMDFRVVECPPDFKGNTAQAGTKTATIETGAKIEVPMFIKRGNIIRVNTQENTYVERVKSDTLY